MKTNKKTLYIAIAFVCILVVSIFVTVKNKDSASLAPADNQKLNPSSEVVSSTTKQETYLPFKYEETEEASEESPTEEKATEVHTTTKPTTTRKNATVNSKPSTIKKEATTPTTKATTTTKKATTTTTKPSTTKPTNTKPTTTQPTTTTPGKVLYYYTDGSTGYTPKPGAEYYSNGCWQIVSWGNTVTDEEIKDSHKNDPTDPWY